MQDFINQFTTESHAQNSCSFAEDIIKCISSMKIQIALLYVQYGPIDNKRALVEIMAHLDVLH